MLVEACPYRNCGKYFGKLCRVPSRPFLFDVEIFGVVKTKALPAVRHCTDVSVAGRDTVSACAG